MIRQGDVYWIDLGEPIGSAPGLRHPHVVIQNNVFNKSRINTAVVCSLATKLERAGVPGNVLLDPGEGDLVEQSVVVVSQIFTVDKSKLVEYTGRLSQARMAEILEGVRLVLEPRDVDE